MADKILDCSMLTDDQLRKVQNGLKVHLLNSLTGYGKSYFGCILKEDMKHLTKYFKYTDKKTLIKGGILGAGLMWAGSKIKKHLNEYEELAVKALSALRNKEETEEESE